MDEKHSKAYPVPCPVCGHAMVGEKSSPENEELDCHRCFNCGSVIVLKPSASPPAEGE